MKKLFQNLRRKLVIALAGRDTYVLNADLEAGSLVVRGSNAVIMNCVFNGSRLTGPISYQPEDFYSEAIP